MLFLQFKIMQLHMKVLISGKKIIESLCTFFSKMIVSHQDQSNVFSHSVFACVLVISFVFFTILFFSFVLRSLMQIYNNYTITA